MPLPVGIHMVFILHPPFENITVRGSFNFFKLSSFSVNNSMQHFLEALPFPLLIFKMPFNHFLPLRIISQVLIFSNSCCHQRGNFILLIVQTSMGVDPGSQDDTRIAEASVG